MQIFKNVFRGLNAVILWSQDVVRTWWRPLTQLGLAAAIWTNGVVIPIMTKSFPDMTALAALVTAVVAAFGVRAWEKHKGLN